MRCDAPLAFGVVHCGCLRCEWAESVCCRSRLVLWSQVNEYDSESDTDEDDKTHNKIIKKVSAIANRYAPRNYVLVRMSDWANDARLKYDRRVAAATTPMTSTTPRIAEN
jgi:hypothetical protein